MDAANAAGQSQAVYTPVPVQDRRPPAGAVERRAVESSEKKSAAQLDQRETTFAPGAAAARIVHEYAEDFETIVEQVGRTVDDPEQSSGSSAGGTAAEHVDVYA